MSDSERELRDAVGDLPASVSQAMTFALRSGWFTIRAGVYDSDTGVCPLVAAGKVVGVWRDNHLADGGPDWGDENQPSPQCFEFAVCFDVFCMEVGVERAVDVVGDELGISRSDSRLAA